MIKNRICLIIPYFGKFPDFFPLWLKSCEFNKSIEWLIYTDDKTAYSYPNNVHVSYTSFEKIKKRIQDNFEFPITLNTPYKLCDYKPTYGEVFQEDIKNYDFWGYCDVDLIWGNIRNFVTDDLLFKYDKLFVNGHFTLFRNAKEINQWYKTLKPIKNYDYKMIYTSNDSFGFDESGGKKSWGGINQMVSNAGKLQLKSRVFDDIVLNYNNFYSRRILPEMRGLSERKQIRLPSAYTFDNGKLMQHILVNEKIISSETMYVHFQKRPMNYNDEIYYGDQFTIVPNMFLSGAKITPEILRDFCEHKLIYPHYLFLRYNNFLRKLKIKK